jgi:lysophospholipase L1-like esterase
MEIRFGTVAVVAAIALASVAAVLVLASAAAPPTVSRNIGPYALEDQRLEAAHIRPDVVFIGDSLTQRWAGVAPEYWDQAWVDRGVGGERSTEIKLRFAQDVLALHPRTVHILAGINDIGGLRGALPLSETETNIAAMASAARSAGIRVVLATTPRVPQWAIANHTPGAEARIEALNAWIRAYAARIGATVADYSAVMQPGWTVDGVHPTAAGYGAMVKVTRQALARA